MPDTLGSQTAVIPSAEAATRAPNVQLMRRVLHVLYTVSQELNFLASTASKRHSAHAFHTALFNE